MFDNKKAAIGATMTWVVATIIILFVVVFFIYASYEIAKDKHLLGFDKFIQKKEASGTGAEQTLLALLQTEINEMSIQGYITNDRYSEVEAEVNLILDELKFDGEAVVYTQNKKISLDVDGLEVE